MTQQVLTPEDAAQLTTRVEDHIFDRKSIEASGKTIQKVAVALANADGGEFVVGVADDEQEPDRLLRWRGGENIERFNGHLQSLHEIRPALVADYSFLSSAGRSGIVLLVRVEKSAAVHQTSDGTVYLRKGAQSLPLKDLQQITDCSTRKVLPPLRTKVSPTQRLNRFQKVES